MQGMDQCHMLYEEPKDTVSIQFGSKLRVMVKMKDVNMGLACTLPPPPLRLPHLLSPAP